MYRIVQLAALSAALAAALVAVSEPRSAQPSPTRFLTDRLETHVLPDGDSAAGPTSAATPLSGCAIRGWPYRDGCASEPQPGAGRTVRVIGLDVVATPTASVRPVHVAQR